jgi:hypothetical protein
MVLAAAPGVTAHFPKIAAVSRTIRWIYLFPGIMLGCAGVWLLSGNPNWLFGLPIQAIALWALWEAFPPESRTLHPLHERISPSCGKGMDSNFLFIAAIIAWFFTYAFFYMRWWIAGWAALALLSGTVIWFVIKAGPSPRPKEIFTDKTALILLMVPTILLRFPFLTQNFTGLQVDEGYNLMTAIGVLQGQLNTPYGSSGAWPFLPRFILASVLKVFGTELPAARGLSALLSVVFVYYFYRWCRLYFGVAASWLAAAFFSYCWWDLFFSLSVFNHLYTVFFEVLGFFFLSKALKEGRKPHFALAGFCMAASIMTYYSGRLVPVMAATALITYWLIEERDFLGAYWEHSLFAALCFLWLAGPQLVFLYFHPVEILGWAQQLSITGIAVQSGNYALPLERIASSFGLNALPCLDPFLGFFCLLGLFLAVRHIRQWKNLAALTGLAFGIIANAFSFSAGATSVDPLYFHAGRSFLVLPFLCFLMAAGLDRVVGLVPSMAKRPRTAWVLFGIILLGSSFALNAHCYFFKFGNDAGAWSPLGFNHLSAVEVIKKLSPANHLVLEGHRANDTGTYSCLDTVEEFATYHKVPVNKGLTLDRPIRAKVTKNVAYIFFTLERNDPLKKKVKRIYPRAVWKSHKNKFGETFLETVEIRKEDILWLQRRHKLEKPLL